MAKAAATRSRPIVLARLESPALRSLLTLIQSSRNPTSPAATMQPIASSPV
jgi:hypothetical protein